MKLKISTCQNALLNSLGEHLYHRGLPKDIVMHNNQYEPFSVEDIEEYDEKMQSYYKNRPIKAPFSTRTVKG